MPECKWYCPQDLNALAEEGTPEWRPQETETPRGFELLSFKDSYGQACSIQESSNVEPHLWVGVDCCRMHITPAQARGIAERLLMFADLEENYHARV